MRAPQVIPGKGMLLQEVPEDVQAIIIERMKEEQQNCECIRSQEYAIYKMLREHNKLMCCEPALAYKGQIYTPEENIVFDNGEIVLTLRVPVNSPLGMALNYKRIESRQGDTEKEN